VSAEHSSGYVGDGSGNPAALFTHRDGGPGMRQIYVEFDRGPTAASAARNALMALEDRVDPGLLDDLRLLVSELVTNSIRHAQGDTLGTVGLEVKLEDHHLRVEVTDAGDGFEPSPRTPDQSQASGWGLYLVDRLADRWGVMRNRLTCVWFEIDTAARLSPQRAA
jgi:anti-sigma regulatory factor (Ser/Thr protein kinase)